MLVPTVEQQAIINAVEQTKSNIMVKALAGTAKTTTAMMIANARPAGGLYLAFGVDIKKEAEKKLPSTWSALTANGLGHRAFGKAIGKRLEVDGKKLGKIISRAAGQISSEEWDALRRLVTLAMQSGLIPKSYPHRPILDDTEQNWAELMESLWLSPDERTIAVARRILTESVKLSFAGIVSYDDQVYMSSMFNGVFPRFQNVILDEAQDLNILNHIQANRAAADRLYVFGDNLQSINAFRGAHSNSMGLIKALRKDWVDLSLTVSFRCPYVIVQRQHQRAPDFKAYELNPRGLVLNGSRHYLRPNEEHFGTWTTSPRTGGPQHPKCSWTWEDIRALEHSEVTILSRNNAQLISMAFKLLRSRVGVKMLGRDIGKSLSMLSKKILPLDDIPLDTCRVLIEQWQDGEISVANANNAQEKIAGLRDRAESLLAVLDGAGIKDSGGLRFWLNELFSKDSGTTQLSTIHKFKGQESDVIIHLDPWRIPSRYAQQRKIEGDPVPLEQEENLLYVCETRVKKVLVLANLEDYNGKPLA